MRTLRNDHSGKQRRTSSTSMYASTASRTQTFSCSTELLRAFEHRAFELGCSFDWLLEEAMQRLLADVRPESDVLPADSVHQLQPLPLTLPLPVRLPVPVPVRQPLVLAHGGERLVIDHHPYIIGRSPTAADLVIDDAAVSRRHAIIEHSAEGWVIADLGSTNGIIINGEVVPSAVLRTGMVLSIGPRTFIVASR